VECTFLFCHSLKLNLERVSFRDIQRKSQGLLVKRSPLVLSVVGVCSILEWTALVKQDFIFSGQFCTSLETGLRISEHKRLQRSRKHLKRRQLNFNDGVGGKF